MWVPTHNVFAPDAIAKIQARLDGLMQPFSTPSLSIMKPLWGPRLQLTGVPVPGRRKP
jgi:hypothetical protein